jgi:hypothetical protein
MLRTDEWSDAEKALLLERWKKKVGEALGLDCIPDDEHAIRWSDPLDLCHGQETLTDVDHRKTRYLFKLGLEIAGTAKKPGKRSRTPWQIGESATHGNARDRQLWLEYARATKGKRMIELDDRAQRFAKKESPLLPFGVEFKAEPLKESTDPEQRIEMPVDSLELRAIRDYERQHDRAILAVISTDVATSVDPKLTLKAWIDLVFGRLSYSRRDALQVSSHYFTPLRAPRREVIFRETG